MEKQENHLHVNTSVFDMTSTTPESVEAYDKIRVNCSLCLTTPRTRQFLSKGKFKINSAHQVDTGNDEDVKVMFINGVKVLNTMAAAPKEPTFIIANGALLVEDSGKKFFDQYKGFYVNGVVIHPKSLDTSTFTVNGAMIPYPDGAILLFQGLNLTNAFLNAALKGATYFVQGIPSDLNKLGNDFMGHAQDVLKETGITAVEPLDLELLKSKNVRFYTSWVTVSEDHAEELLPHVEGYIGITIIPSGFKMMRGGKLDRLAIRRFGTCIYVDGDLQIHEEEADALAAVEQLQVTGKVIVADSLADVFFDKCSQYGDLTVYQGEWIEHDGSEILLDIETLEQLDKGATFRFENANVEIAEDVSVELLSPKIHEIILQNSSITLGIDQQKALLKKFKNHDSDLIIREHIRKNESNHKPEPESKMYTETKINTAYYKF